MVFRQARKKTTLVLVWTSAKLVGKKKVIDPMWKVLMKDFDLGEPTSSLDHVVMWVTLQNNAHWDCFKTPILQEILRIQNLHQVEHCRSSSRERVQSYQERCISNAKENSWKDWWFLGVHSTRMSNEQRYCGQLQRHDWIQDLCRSKKKLPCSEKPGADISSWSYDMEGHARKCVEIYFELVNRTTQQLHKVATPCIDDHQFKEE